MDTLDKTDLQILRTLQENARLTTKELAARVSLSSTPVSGSFVYNGILWRKISADEKSITVKAEQDGTMMQIAVDLGLPWVLRMDGNPLGIDWRLEKQ